MKEYNLTVNGNEYVVSVEEKDATTAEVKVNGAKYKVELNDPSKIKKAAKPQVSAAPASHPVANAAANAPAPAVPKAAAGSTGNKSVLSPLPGVILDIKVAVGDTVEVGQTLMVLEAMKMENNVDSSFGGVVKSINVKCSDSVLEGDVLVTIE